MLKKELSKALRGRTSLAFFWIQLSADHPDTILPSMLGGFQEEFATYFRESDTVIGIDEDQLLLLGFTTDHKGALLVQNKIKQAIHESLPESSNIKIGFSLFPDEGRSISNLFQRARPLAYENGAADSLEIRAASSKTVTSASERARDRQRIGTIQLYFTRARGRLFQRLLSLDAKALWHGLSNLTKKEQRDFLNRLPFDYKLAPDIEEIMNSNPWVVSDKGLEKHLEEIIYSMIIEEGLEERKQNAANIAARLNNVEALPVLPVVALKLFNILADPDATINALVKVIETDASLTLKLLKIVNSAFYGVSRKIDTVKESVMILGTDEIKNLSFGLSAAKTFQNISFEGLANPNALWHHSIATAIIAEHLCLGLPGIKGAGVFTAGLIHDTGKIFLMEHFPELYNSAYRTAIKYKIPIYEMEEERYELNHAMIGKFIANRWNLPESLSQAIACHHHHQQDAAFDTSCLSAVIGLSDYLYYKVTESGISSPPSASLTFGQFSVLKRIFKVLNNEVLETMAQEIVKILEDNQELFSLG
ncbi:MAG: HDOD domain-containing protein [Desulfobacterium sp.]|nr:HDOD domain-containing protein [Desulfobacterium sp.]MBU4036049.1 HDOD domain-containing protein [Pseudomonadota bacterium]